MRRLGEKNDSSILIICFRRMDLLAQYVLTSATDYLDFFLKKKYLLTNSW